jgi:tetrapyrrole methylase family protein/MazG family protein
LTAWEDLVGLVRRLRGPGGCPWDREQTHLSLRRYALEEAREVASAIDEGDMHALAEELGDLLLQVLLHAIIAEERGAFGPGDVLDALADKLVRRHPHVFGDATARTAAEVRRSWEDLKRAERRGPQAGLLDEVPRSLPALAEAQEVGKRAARVGFDWGTASAAWEKVREEAEEFAAAWAEPGAGGRPAGAATGAGIAVDSGSGPGTGRRSPAGSVEDEFGDLLFALANVARLLDLDAEAALASTNEKFRRRFAFIEAGARERGREMRSLSLHEMEDLWQAAKGAEGLRKESSR